MGADALNFFGTPFKAWFFTAGKAAPIVRGGGIDQPGISAPLLVAVHSDTPDHFTIVDFLGVAFWALGFLFEAIGDWQLTRFKAKPENAGNVMNAGLWRYTRHPNYFGDATLWWGYFIIAAGTRWGFATVFSPAIMTFMLVRVSGVALLERSLKKRRPGYEEYIARTSSFIPMPPKRV